jgi:hypothetical protein
MVSPLVKSDKSTVVVRDRFLEAREARDKWIYEQCLAGTLLKNMLSWIAKRKKWPRITSKQGIQAAAKRYAELHGLRLPPRRKK